MNRIKLSEYAKRNGISRQTAYRWWRNGNLQGIQTETGTILIDVVPETTAKGVVLYARVSSSQNKDNLDSQMERLKLYAAAKSYVVYREVKEVGSGLNDNRAKLQAILDDDKWSVLIVDHKDRLTRFGFKYIETLLKRTSQQVEVINDSINKDDLMDDLVSIITSFCARIYGQRRSKRKTEKIIEGLTND